MNDKCDPPGMEWMPVSIEPPLLCEPGRSSYVLTIWRRNKRRPEGFNDRAMAIRNPMTGRIRWELMQPEGRGSAGDVSHWLRFER